MSPAAPTAPEAEGPEVLTAAGKAEILVEALPYIRRFSGKVVVVKLGGNAMSSDLSLFAEDVVLLRSVGMQIVVVHGGGPQIGDLMARLGKAPEFVDGLRVTDAETLDIARMVLVGKVNRDIVRAINVHGSQAVGLSGEDGGLLDARIRNPALGFVGDVVGVRPRILERLLASGLIPVVATIGTDDAGQAYNINADSAAGSIAAALAAEKLVYLTDVDGIRRDAADEGSTLSTVTAAELRRLIDGGEVTGGMIPKATSCIDAVSAGVGHAHILDGRTPHVLLLEIFTRSGIGTMVNP